MATISVNSSTNINAVSYAANDVIQVPSSATFGAVLTIDAQVPGDVTKVEGTLIGGLTVSGLNGKIRIVNTSTTVPLILKFSGAAKSFNASAPSSTTEIRGDWIEIGTGTGALGQTLNMQIGGKGIDWPPFVQCETAAGSGVYVTLLNIGGAYKSQANTTYPLFRTFADVGTTPEMGAFFEYDEYNGGATYGQIKFATAAGGWVPPAGAKIRYPNIHITSTIAAVTSRCTIGAATGIYDWDTVAFSNRWGGSAQNWPSKMIFRDVGMAAPYQTFNINNLVDIDGLYIGANLYTATAGGLIIQGTAPVSIDNLHGVGLANNGCHTINNMPRLVKLGYTKASVAGRGATFQSALVLSNLIAPPKNTVTVGPIVCNGGMIYMTGHNENLRFYDIAYSDYANGVASNTSDSMFFGNFFGRNTIFEKIRILPGGCPPRGYLFSPFDSTSKNVAIHDVLIDGKNPQTLAVHTNGFSGDISGNRLWLTNIELNNLRSLGFSKGVLGTYPCRLSNFKSNTPNGWPEFAAGVKYEMTAALNTTTSIKGAGQLDTENFHVFSQNSGRTVGAIIIMAGTLESATTLRTVTAGTVGVDLTFVGSRVLLPSNGVDFTLLEGGAVKGITGFASSTVTLEPTVTGVTAEFKMVNAGDTSWPGSWTTMTPANLQSALTALSGYSASVGFQMRVRITTTTAVSTRQLGGVRVQNVDTDAAFVPTEVGFIQIGISGAAIGSDYSVQDVSGSPVQHVYGPMATSSIQAEYPYAFDGVAAQYKVVVRKAGYSEASVTGTCYQAGDSVPVSMTAGLACTDASVAGIAVDGVNKTITPTGTKTFAEIYQQSQWWSHQKSKMIYDVPMVAEDSTAFALTTGWVLISDTMTNAALLQGGALRLSSVGIHNLSLGSIVLELNAVGNFDLGGTSFAGLIDLRNLTGSAVTVQLPAGTTYTTASNVGGAITVALPATYQSVTVNNLVVGSRVQVYDLTSNTELANGIAGASTYTWTDSVPASASRAIRLRVAYVSGATAKQFVEAAIGTCGTGTGDAAISYLANQVADTTYNTNAIDGSTVTGITIAPAPARVSINIAGGAVTWPQIYAYQVYWLATSVGIADQAAFIAAPDTANYLLTGFDVRNTSATPLTITGGYGRDSTTGLVKDCIDVAGSIGNIYPMPDHAIPYSSGSGLTAGQDANLAAVASGVASITGGSAVVSADVKKIKGQTISGAGTEADPWGP